MILSSVVLPQPLGPMMLKNSFARIERLTSDNALTSEVPSLTVFLKLFDPPSISTMSFACTALVPIVQKVQAVQIVFERFGSVHVLKRNIKNFFFFFYYN